MDFGRVLGRFWESEILDFRIFFDVFSKHFSNNFLEGRKIAKKGPEKPQVIFLAGPGGMRGLRGREKERGGRPKM